MTAADGSKAPRILAYIRDEAEADATARIVDKAMAASVAPGGGGRGTLRILASTPGPLLAALPTGIIWDLHAASVPSLTAIVREVISTGRVVPPILGCVDLADVGARQLIQLARLIPCLRLSARSVDGFDDQIIDWLPAPHQPTGEQAIINGLATARLTRRFALAVKAAVAAKRHMPVSAFATAIHVPQRTVEGRLRAEGSFEAWRLLGWSVSLHAFWRLEVRRWSLKRVAVSLGFGSAEALGSHLQRHLGERPRALLARQSFESILEAYRDRIESGFDGEAST